MCFNIKIIIIFKSNIIVVFLILIYKYQDVLLYFVKKSLQHYECTLKV
jgi:hypothetical protein